MSTTKEISIKSGSNENSNLRVETVVEDEGSVSNAIDEEDDGFQGNVATRNTTPTPHQRRQENQLGSANSIPSDSNSTASSWASKDDLRRQKRQEQKTKRGRKWSSIKKSRNRKEASVTPPRPGQIKRSKTPTTNNLSTGFFSEPDDSIEGEDLTASLLPPTEILYGGAGDGRGAVYSRQNRSERNQQFTAPPQQHQQQLPSSFRKWMAEGMLDTLNVVAGISLSATGTILSPPIALTKALIPSIIALIVDTLDKATPRQLQDWFRIISSSVYHLFVVLVAGSTERGKRFRNQITQAAHSFLEAWSAPESRQVVVDGMATGVKLADALHTPEMKIFLDQLGILGCRFGDAMASGKSKECLLNFKDLIWTIIELASDDSTTLALAEVTAHLCHALQEVDDSFTHATPRSVRNAHNEQAYLNSSLMTKDYPFESMEKIILSSLGMDGNGDERDHNDESTYDTDDGMSIEESIPSNVAFRVVGSDPLEIPNLEQINENKTGDVDKSNWEKCKERVDVNLLQKKILNESRPRARQTKNVEGNSGSKVYSRSRNDELPSTTPSFRSEMQESEKQNLTEDYAKIEEDMEELLLLRDPQNPSTSVEHRNPANTKELYDKFERMETKEPEKPSHVQFFTALDELMNTKRMEKEGRMQDCVVAEETEGDNDRTNAKGSARRAKVRVLRKGVTREEKLGSKAVRERYANLRRLWKYPPSFLHFSAIGALCICIFWVGFGIYGMYALFHQVVYQGLALPPIHPEPLVSTQQQQQQTTTTMDNLDFGTKLPSPDANLDNRRYDERTDNYRPNEIVIRIVKEVVHVHEDGIRIENYKEGNKEYEKDAVDANGDELTEEVEKKDRNIQKEAFNNLNGISADALHEEEINMIQRCVVSSLEVGDDTIQDYEDPSSYDAFASLSEGEVDRVKDCLAQLQ